MRHLIGVGTPRGLQGRLGGVLATLVVLITAVPRRLTAIVVAHRRIAVMRNEPSSPTAIVVNSSAMGTYTTGCQASCPGAVSMRRESSAATMSARESDSGFFTRSRGPVSSVTKRGWTSPGRLLEIPAPGPKCRRMNNSRSSTCRLKRRPTTFTVAIVLETTCLRTASSPSI